MFVSDWQPAFAREDYFAMSLEELLSINVISASRSLTSIVEAPSVMTVITVEDISKQGLKTLEEVLQRVPGFFTSEETTRALISNRGIITNKLALLIDGHSVNSIIQDGYGQQQIFPLLENVERIEIVRGPGSTLWGNEAALGVINIITRNNWEDLDSPYGKVTASYDYANNIDRQIAKLSYDKKLGDDSGMTLTGNFFTSDPDTLGRFVSGRGDSFIQGIGNPQNLRDFDDSWEAYGKLKLNSLILSARTTNFVSGIPWMSNTLDTSDEMARRGHFDYENSFIDAKYNLKVGDNSEIDFNVFYDRIRNHAIEDLGGTRSYIKYQRADEDGIGGEIIYTTEHFDNHEIKLGTYYRYVDVIRFDERRFYDDGSITQTDHAESGEDNTFAFFAEDTWQFADKWIAVYGGRIDYNDFREDATIFLPRAGLIWKTTDRLTLKYLYNTGYIRPYVQQSLGTAGKPFQVGDDTYWVGADESEIVKTHDIQVLYNHKDIYFGVTFYYMTYENFIEWPGIWYQEDPDYLATFQNVGDMTSKGVELDFKVQLFDSLAVYGNYAYTHARLDDMNIMVKGVPVDLTGRSFIEPGGALTGVPEHTWNLGVDYNIFQDVDLNIHWRGWSEAWAQEKRSEPYKYKKFGPEHYVDLNLRWKNILNMFELAFYCKDLFDNTGDIPTPTLPAIPAGEDVEGTPTKSGLLPGFGRTLGIKVKFEF